MELPSLALLRLFLFVYPFIWVVYICHQQQMSVEGAKPPPMSSYARLVDDDGDSFANYFRTLPSVETWENIEKSKRFTILSMNVDHHSDTSWYMPALHAKDSIGYNRTIHQRGFTNRFKHKF
jgi:hypothetical protein